MKKTSLSNYLIVMAIITVIFGVVYVTVQQGYRTSANDPQIQIARDINAKLNQRKSVDNFFADTIDIAQSLSTFVTLYNDNGKPMRSSGYLNGKLPEMPSGVFTFAQINNEHAVTWQPRSGVRMAMVIVKSDSSPYGFVAAGRSLKEVEVREHNLIITIFFGWIICIGLILFHAALPFFEQSKKN